MFKLPELVWELDCEPLGYPGLTVTMVLNPPIDADDASASRDASARDAEWDGAFYRQLARIMKAVTIPGEWTDDGQELTVALGDGRAVWDLEHDRGFDPQVLQWALRQYAAQRNERLQAESKN